MHILHQDIGKPRASHNDRAGSALVTVLGVSVILMLAGLTMAVLSGQSMHRVKRTAHYAQARAAAEAGVADMIAKLGTNYTLWQSNTYTATFFSNGAYYVTTELQTNGNVRITSDGIYLDASNRTIMELLGTLQTHYNDLYDPNNAVMSDGEIEIGPGNFALNGNISGNADLEAANGANGTISGNVAVVGSIDSDLLDDITGTATNDAPPVTIPPTGPFNFDSYRTMATNGGTYLEGNQSLTGTNLQQLAANGILYVNGDLAINNLSTFWGTIVANGNIVIKNNFTQYDFPGSSNMPSLLSTGSIELENNVVLNGVVYARVDIDIQNFVTINGGVISGGTTAIQNNITINSGQGYPVWDPLNPEVPPEVISGGWLK